jgi:hypothetical protein
MSDAAAQKVVVWNWSRNGFGSNSDGTLTYHAKLQVKYFEQADQVRSFGHRFVRSHRLTASNVLLPGQNRIRTVSVTISCRFYGISCAANVLDVFDLQLPSLEYSLLLLS